MSGTQQLLSECHHCPGRLARSLQRAFYLAGWVGLQRWAFTLFTWEQDPESGCRGQQLALESGQLWAVSAMSASSKAYSHHPRQNWRPPWPWPFDLFWLLCLGPDSCPTLTLSSSLFRLPSPSVLLGCDIWDKAISWGRISLSHPLRFTDSLEEGIEGFEFELVPHAPYHLLAVGLSKSLNVSDPQFPHLYIGKRSSGVQGCPGTK